MKLKKSRFLLLFKKTAGEQMVDGKKVTIVGRKFPLRLGRYEITVEDINSNKKEHKMKKKFSPAIAFLRDDEKLISCRDLLIKVADSIADNKRLNGVSKGSYAIMAVLHLEGLCKFEDLKRHFSYGGGNYDLTKAICRDFVEEINQKDQDFPSYQLTSRGKDIVNYLLFCGDKIFLDMVKKIESGKRIRI
jgi:hypothetical protein